MVSGAMLMEVETVLQTQEPVIRPAWHAFASSLSGIWKGVGAVFSPITAEMEPIETGNRKENLFDCYNLSCVEAVQSPSGGQITQITRKETSNRYLTHNLPKFEAFNFGTSDVMEEDVMGMEPGLVFFERPS